MKKHRKVSTVIIQMTRNPKINKGNSHSWIRTNLWVVGVFIFISLMTIKMLKAHNAEIDSYIENVMEKRHIPGVAVAIIQNQQVIYKQRFGFANLETNSLVTDSSIFQLASLTKPFTALVMMRLVEEGKVDLKSPVTQYIDSLPESYQKITIANLLTHTAGFQDQINLMYSNSPVMDISTADQLEIILEKPLLFSPGENCSYADPGYFLLGMVIENASGMSYQEYLQETIFNKTGMKNSQVENRWKIIKNRVEPYKYRNGEIINGRRDYQHELPSHFGILSTIDDLIKWNIVLRDGEIISQSYLNQMWDPAILNNGNDALVWGSKYGYGWMLGDVRGNKYAEHGGFTGTFCLHFIDKQLSVIVLSNLDVMSGSDPRSIAHHIAGLVSPDLANPADETTTINNDGDPMIDQLILSYADGVKNNSSDELLSGQFANFLHELPPPVKERYLTDLNSFTELNYIGKDDVSENEITKGGKKINTIYHYQVITEKSNQTYTFYISPDNTIAWFTIWKD